MGNLIHSNYTIPILMFIYTMRDICAWNDRKLRIDNWIQPITPITPPSLSLSLSLSLSCAHTYVMHVQSHSNVMVLVDPRRNSELWIPCYLHCHRDKGKEESRLDICIDAFFAPRCGFHRVESTAFVAIQYDISIICNRL